MLTHYCIFNVDTAEVVFSGSLNECSVEVQKLCNLVPNTEFAICKVSPVSTHCVRKSFIATPLTNVLDFPVRRPTLQ